MSKKQKRAWLFNADEFLRHLLENRFLWIAGILGSGKTLLSVALADELLRLRLVDGVIANFPSILPPSLGPDDGTIIRRCVILDEGHHFLDSRTSLVNDVSQYGAYARKTQSIWLIPSVHPVDKRVRSLICWRSAKIDILNVWVYRWMQTLDYSFMQMTHYGGWFALVWPTRWFGLYDTEHIVTDDAKIPERQARTIYLRTQGKGIQEARRREDWVRALEILGAED